MEDQIALGLKGEKPPRGSTQAILNPLFLINMIATFEAECFHVSLFPLRFFFNICIVRKGLGRGRKKEREEERREKE